MFNLLPENLRQAIKKDYKLRRVIISLIFVVFIQISFVIFMFPTWLVSVYREADVNARGVDMNNHLSKLNIAYTTENIKLLNSKLTVIQNTLEYPEIVPYINAILSNKTNSISISNIVYSNTDSKNASISIEGNSTTREALLGFVKKLQSSNSFKSVDLPISNFTKDKDLVFSIKIIISEP